MGGRIPPAFAGKRAVPSFRSSARLFLIVGGTSLGRGRGRVSGLAERAVPPFRFLLERDRFPARKDFLKYLWGNPYVWSGFYVGGLASRRASVHAGTFL